uniref:U-box domain-containing protein n=1 Tax=Grammatophora oceanica TaxID=210454 RepID=A0A7S1Y2K4_9STRA|mmetsp:Transcript_13101/g.19316  ORF Transcript_13101/g.19316 Transcript_13101/m.19316 type:complete len:234 (+) Transcript_13101:3-704(+)
MSDAEPDWTPPPVTYDTEPPRQLLCPITLELMNDPVVAADGFSYERSAIESVFARANNKRRKPKSPLTGKAFRSMVLFPNVAIRSQCRDFGSSPKAGSISRMIDDKVEQIGDQVVTSDDSCDDLGDCKKEALKKSKLKVLFSGNGVSGLKPPRWKGKEKRTDDNTNVGDDDQRQQPPPPVATEKEDEPLKSWKLKRSSSNGSIGGLLEPTTSKDSVGEKQTRSGVFRRFRSLS